MQAGTILTYRLCSRAGQVGAGGVTTDLVKDRSARLLPLTDRDAPDMIGSLRMAPLLADSGPLTSLSAAMRAFLASPSTSIPSSPTGARPYVAPSHPAGPRAR